MVGVAIMGYGVVGSGVAELLQQNADHIEKKAGQEIALRYVLDVRDFPDSPHAGLMVKDFSIIERDPDVQVVVECIGGAGIALELTRRALHSGKHVVTTNKELVAEHGAELLRLAEARNLNFLFEGSVGGGIPVLRPIAQCLSANRLSEVTGILNGTTNYILTQMLDRGTTFEKALEEARANGYAEADPSDDIYGRDACRKICILSSLAFGLHIYPSQVNTEGIAQILQEDVRFARDHGYRVKLLGRAICTDGGKDIYVAPHLVPESHPLSVVSDVFNAVWIRGDAIGDVMFYGRGAGRLPTASAVVADVIDAVKHMGARKWLGWQTSDDHAVHEPCHLQSRWYVRSDEGGSITDPMTTGEFNRWASGRSQTPIYRIRVL